MGLSDGGKIFPIGLAVLIQYRSVTDTQPATQPPSHVAVATSRITLYAVAPSAKMKCIYCFIVFVDAYLCLTIVARLEYHHMMLCV